MAYKILFSNLGYARGIDGSFSQHIGRIHRHFYTNTTQQQQVLEQFRNIILEERPDLCCIVEIDSGSWNTGHFSQIHYLLDKEYVAHSIAGKYGEDSLLAKMPFYHGKCNAFLAKTPLPHQKLFFRNGSKRLIYKVTLPGGITLLFGHFSLSRRVRERQFDEVRAMLERCEGEVILLADFNILHGFQELDFLLRGANLKVLNKEEEHTFVFGNRYLTLDLCICTPNLVSRTSHRVVPQPFSDHSALLVEVML